MLLLTLSFINSNKYSKYTLNDLEYKTLGLQVDLNGSKWRIGIRNNK